MKKKEIRKCLSFFLAVSMSVGMLPVNLPQTVQASEIEMEAADEEVKEIQELAADEEKDFLIEEEPEIVISDEEANDSIGDQECLGTENVVETFDELKNAISSAAQGTKENPTVITISGSIQVTEHLDIQNNHIRLSGGGIDLR